MLFRDAPALQTDHADTRHGHLLPARRYAHQLPFVRPHSRPPHHHPVTFTQHFIDAFGIDPKKVLTIFGEHGNIGPASVPIVLSKLREMGRLKKGTRIALLGIGSGLNCSMAEVVW